MTPNELWDKYKQPGKFDGFTGDIVCRLDFLAALAEYGQAVRDRDAEICGMSTKDILLAAGEMTAQELRTVHAILDSRIAAISREPLP